MLALSAAHPVPATPAVPFGPTGTPMRANDDQYSRIARESASSPSENGGEGRPPRNVPKTNGISYLFIADYSHICAGTDSQVYSQLHFGRTRESPTTEAASTHAWSARGRPPTGASTGRGTRARHGAQPARVPSRGQPMLCARVHAGRERTWRRWLTRVCALRCTAFPFERNVASNVALTRSRHSRETPV